MDRLVCGRCGRSFATVDGRGMIEAIKGPCPCGGRFSLQADPPPDGAGPGASERAPRRRWTLRR